jgi:hypothetical protein
MDGPAERELAVGLPDYGVEAVVRLHQRSSPGLTALVWNALERPFESVTGHAAFDGEEIFCFLPTIMENGQPVEPPVEDWTMWPKPGDLMFFHRRVNERTGREPTYELAFMYGETDLRHYYETGLPGCVIGHFVEGHDAFTQAAIATRKHGQTKIVISRR